LSLSTCVYRLFTFIASRKLPYITIVALRDVKFLPLWRTCLICTGVVAFHFCTIDGQAASAELSKNIVPVAYRIALTPDAATARFTGTEEVDVEVKQPTDTVVVNAAGLAFSMAHFTDDSKSQATISLDEKAETASLHFSQPLSAGSHTLALSYSGSIGTGGSGLFSVEYDTGLHMVVTQLEFNLARRVFPCWDEPSAKATFTLSATLPANDAVISNTPVAVESAAGTDASGVPLKRITFATTPRMSPYLLVLVAGKLQSVRGQAGKVDVGVWTTAGRVQQGNAALATALQLLPLYDRYFGIEYSLPKLDMIAVPHLGSENSASHETR